MLRLGAGGVLEPTDALQCRPFMATADLPFVRRIRRPQDWPLDGGEPGPVPIIVLVQGGSCCLAFPLRRLATGGRRLTAHTFRSAAASQ